MKCEMCGAHVSKTALFRINPKGVAGRWACEKHVAHYDVEIDPVVKLITDVVSKKGTGQ